MTQLTLKNGSTEAEPLVRVVMMSLSSLLKSNSIAFYEAVMCARDRNHKPFGNTGDILKALAILDSTHHMHDSMRNVILSAVEGDMLEMRLVSPIKEDGF